jgi:hypothetical protein
VEEALVSLRKSSKGRTNGLNPLGDLTKFQGSLDLGEVQGSYDVSVEEF